MKTFSARETVWLQQLDGVELAGFGRRAIAFVIDWLLVGILLSVTATLGALAYVGVAHLFGRAPAELRLASHTGNITISPNDKPATGHKGFSYHVGLPDEQHAAEEVPRSRREKLLDEAIHILIDVIVPCLYFGLFLWRSNGRTPGKRLMKIRVISLVHPHMTFWHSVERALGYGAAALEGGFGFIQYFIHPYHRCAQDRLAETIVVTESSYRTAFPTRPTAPAVREGSAGPTSTTPLS